MKRPIGTSLTGSFRLVGYITPDTFLKPIQIISTVFSYTANGGETAIGEAEALNYFSVDEKTIKFVTKQKHKTAQEAIDFHLQTLLNKP